MKHKCTKCGSLTDLPTSAASNSTCPDCGVVLVRSTQPADETPVALCLFGGATLGASLAGPVGAIVGGILGGVVGQHAKRAN